MIFFLSFFNSFFFLLINNYPLPDQNNYQELPSYQEKMLHFPKSYFPYITISFEPNYLGNEEEIYFLKEEIAKPLSIASGDLNGDGIEDLIIGYFIQNSQGLLCFYKGKEEGFNSLPLSLNEKLSIDSPSFPFERDVKVFRIEKTPDFLGIGDYDADGLMDIVIASKNENELQFLFGDEKEKFARFSKLKLQGFPTAFLSEDINRRDGLKDLIIGIETSEDFQLIILESPDGAYKGCPQIIPFWKKIQKIESFYDPLVSFYTNLMVIMEEEKVVLSGVDRKISLSPELRVEENPKIIWLFDENKSFEIIDEEIKIPLRLNGDAGIDWVVINPEKTAPTLKITTYFNNYIVTNTNDSGSGSLRKAITDANSNPGADIITFNIPGTGPFTITPTTALPNINDPLTIDATTQPGYSGTPLIELNGTSAGSNTHGLYINASGCTIKGIAINRFSQSGIYVNDTYNIIQANFIGTNPSGTSALANLRYGIIAYYGNNLIGGTTSAQKNLISGNSYSGVCLAYSNAHHNTIQGNYIGTDITGTLDLGNGGSGVLIYSASNNTVGGTALGSKNLISGNNYAGVTISQSSSSSNLVQGNWIGINALGDQGLPNTNAGVMIEDSPSNTIGGTTPAARNIISGNNDGVHIEEYYVSPPNNAINNLVQGNYIGTDPTGFYALKNNYSGVAILKASNNTIGGATSGAGNVISGNQSGIYIGPQGENSNYIQGNYIGVTADGIGNLGNIRRGIWVSSIGGTGNKIGGNSATEGNIIAYNGIAGDHAIVVENGNTMIRKNLIFSNYNMGIDLGNNGPTLNDLLDPDTGPNDLQNFPQITSATVGTGCYGTANGTLNSIPNNTFDVDVYISGSCDPSGHGEGATLLGSASVPTNNEGNGTFSVPINVPFAAGQVLTATATNAGGATSEFSQCYTIVNGTLPPEVTNLMWCTGTKNCLNWSSVSLADSYNLYRGVPSDLPKLLDGNIDSCTRGSFISTTTGNVLNETPSAGTFYWYIVRAINSCGEGPAGNTSFTFRKLETSGVCP